ncbi:MAG: hypothetical protein AB1522_03900 [Chloroflexota bacterium]
MEILTASTTRLKKSLPKASVPNQYSDPGGERRTPLIEFGLRSTKSGAAKAKIKHRLESKTPRNSGEKRSKARFLPPALVLGMDKSTIHWRVKIVK